MKPINIDCLKDMNLNATQIIPRLWLGNYYNSTDYNFLKRNRISVIVNCTKELPFPQIRSLYKYRVPVDDNLQRIEIVSMADWLEKILPILSVHYRNGENILVHCHAGMQRSAIVVLSFLYAYCHMNPKVAYNQMRHLRPIVFEPYMNFANSFRLFFGEYAYQQLIS